MITSIGSGEGSKWMEACPRQHFSCGDRGARPGVKIDLRAGFLGAARYDGGAKNRKQPPPTFSLRIADPAADHFVKTRTLSFAGHRSPCYFRHTRDGLVGGWTGDDDEHSSDLSSSTGPAAHIAAPTISTLLMRCNPMETLGAQDRSRGVRHTHTQK